MLLLLRHYRLIMLLLISFFPVLSYSSVCANLTGSWQGEMQDQQHTLMPARLWFAVNAKDEFSGGFILRDGGTGALRGRCVSISDNEAYLVLQPDAPAYNPCRGTLLVDKSMMATHFFCFNPNQSGYFIKSQ
jgi:hypothetical protein